MFNGVLEAALAVFDYKTDEQFFKAVGGYAFSLSTDEWNVMLNKRAWEKKLECLVPDCEHPIWAIDNELLSGYNIEESKSFLKLLIEYTCIDHPHQYEVVSLYERKIEKVL